MGCFQFIGTAPALCSVENSSIKRRISLNPDSAMISRVNAPTVQQIPSQLGPLSKEALPTNGGIIYVQKAQPQFRKWFGPPPHNDFGGKAFVEAGEEGTFAELAVLRLFIQEGWEGVWISSFGRKYYVKYPEALSTEKLPSKVHEICEHILKRPGFPSGAWDLCCVKGEAILFVELKRSKKDRIRETQIAWLQKSLDAGLNSDNFLIVEWTLL